MAGHRSYGGSYRRQYAGALWDGWATPTSGALWCEDGHQHAPLMLLVKVGSNVDEVHTVQFGRGSHVVKKKATEKEIATRRAYVLPGHDEVGGMDTQLSWAASRRAWWRRLLESPTS